MPLLVVCRTIITHGNASEAPASALVPMRPRKNPSNVMTPANASRVRMFGAARRSNAGRIGPSSSSLVRAAAAGAAAVFPGVNDGWGIATLRSLIERSSSLEGREQRLDEASFSEAGRLGSRVAAREPGWREICALSGAGANDNFLAEPQLD